LERRLRRVQAFGADPVNYFHPRGLIASNFLNHANDDPNSAENQAYAENALASDASLPPSFYRGLGNFVMHTFQGLIQLPGATMQSISSELTFSSTLVTDPGAAWNETQQTITQIPQSVLSRLDLVRQTSATAEGRAELLVSAALFATPFLESNVARAAVATESLPSALAPTGELAAESDAQSELLNLLTLRTRQLELGTDPARGFIQAEGTGGVRIEQALGRSITRSPEEAVDFVDSQLGTISLKGPIPMQGDVQGLANAAIRDANFNTATKTLIIDTKGLSPAQISVLKAAVQAGTANSSKTIIYLH
jgi:hypothetical protein